MSAHPFVRGQFINVLTYRLKLNVLNGTSFSFVTIPSCIDSPNYSTGPPVPKGLSLTSSLNPNLFITNLSPHTPSLPLSCEVLFFYRTRYRCIDLPYTGQVPR